jgi:hypothetical protein
MAVRCKEMTERLKIIKDQEIEAIETILSASSLSSRRAIWSF